MSQSREKNHLRQFNYSPTGNFCDSNQLNKKEPTNDLCYTRPIATSTPRASNSTTSLHMTQSKTLLKDIDKLPECARRFVLTAESMNLKDFTDLDPFPTRKEWSMPCQTNLEKSKNCDICNSCSRRKSFDEKEPLPKCNQRCPKTDKNEKRCPARPQSLSPPSRTIISTATSSYQRSSTTSFRRPSNSRSSQHIEQLRLHQRPNDLSCGDAQKIHNELNEVFIKRLADIDNQTSDGADMTKCLQMLQLKVITYQEWVEMLLKNNENGLKNMAELEKEVTDRLNALKCKANILKAECEESLAAKYRKDIANLLRIIRNGYREDKWSLEGLHFETLSPNEIFGSCDNERKNSRLDRNKSLLNTKALAIEVANKHDMICELKRQIVCIEDEIQNAQKKIQLKDDVIKELRNDLKAAKQQQLQLAQASNKGLCVDASVQYCEKLIEMPPVNSEAIAKDASMSCIPSKDYAAQTTESHENFDFTAAKLNNLDPKAQTRTDIAMVMESEVDVAHQMSVASCGNYSDSFCNERVLNCEYLQNPITVKECQCHHHHEPLIDTGNISMSHSIASHEAVSILKKSESDKANALRRLENIHRQLINLEAESNEHILNGSDTDSGFSSKCEQDQDMKIIDAIRRRFMELNNSNIAFQKQIKQLQTDIQCMKTKVNDSDSLSTRNSQVLREIADQLTNITGKTLQYETIYSSDINPFCDFVDDMHRDFENQQEKLCSTIKDMSQRIRALEDKLNSSSKDDFYKSEINKLEAEICKKNEKIDCLNRDIKELKDHHQKDMAKAAINIEEIRKLRENCCKSCINAENLQRELQHSEQTERLLKSEIKNVQNDLEHAKQKNDKLMQKIQKLTLFANTQENNRLEIVAKFNKLQETHNCQIEEMRTLHNQLIIQQKHLENMEKAQNGHLIERQKLCDDLLVHKELEATMIGKHRALQEQFQRANLEISRASKIIKEQQCTIRRNECSHNDIVKNLQDTNNKMRLQLRKMREDYRCLEDQYEKRMHVDKQNEKVLESFRKWKEAQLKADEVTRVTFQQYEDNIHLLLEEKALFLEQFRDLHRDYTLLQNKLECLRRCDIGGENRLEPNEISMISKRVPLVSNHISFQDGQNNLNPSTSTPKGNC